MDTATGTPVVGMVGAGQLARMTHQAAISLGQSLRVLATHSRDPAAQVAPRVLLGSHTDLNALRELAAGCSAVTLDHEHVPAEHLEVLEGEGVAVHPGPSALRHAQDKLVMRRALAECGLAVPPFAEVTAVADAEAFGLEHGWPCVLKARRGGYDGRGVWMLDSPADAQQMIPERLDAGTDLLVEPRVPMRRELTALVARSPFGQAAAWPVVETVQRGGVCVEVVAPAPGLGAERAEQAQELALTLAEKLGVVGLLAVELFETATGVLVNELAMRPHNSGHWSIEGAVTSQFEQHLRAVLDYPLGSTAARAPVTVMANVLAAPSTPAMSLDERLHHLFARYPHARVHVYGKPERPGRKIGHVTVPGETLEPARAAASNAASWLAAACWPDGYDPHGRR